MIHRHIVTKEWSLMALESLMERGNLADWREFTHSLSGNKELARDALRVSDYVEDRASASLARALILHRFPELQINQAPLPKDAFTPLSVPKTTLGV